MDGVKKSLESAKTGDQSALKLLMECSLWNSNARIEKYGQNLFCLQGQATDKGLINFFADLTSMMDCYYL